MEIYLQQKEVSVFYVTATSFPDGVKEAWEKLHKMIQATKGRNFFGISHGNENGGITYKAAVEESFPNEAEKYGCGTSIIPQGEYLSITIHDYMNHLPLIGQAFRRLLAYPELDDITPCVEWYKSDKEVISIVRKKMNE